MFYTLQHIYKYIYLCRIHYNIHLTRFPIKKAHFVGTSVVLTLDPIHVKRLAIDELTFFIQKPVENGIVLEMHKIETQSKKGEGQVDEYR